MTANQWTKTSKNLSEMTSPLYLFLNQIFDRLLRDYGAMICDSVRGFGTIGGEGIKRWVGQLFGKTNQSGRAEKDNIVARF